MRETMLRRLCSKLLAVAQSCSLALSEPAGSAAGSTLCLHQALMPPSNRAAGGTSPSTGENAQPAPRRGRQAEHAGGAAAMAGAFAGKAALMAAGVAVLHTDPPLLVVDLLYSELLGGVGVSKCSTCIFNSSRFVGVSQSGLLLGVHGRAVWTAFGGEHACRRQHLSMRAACRCSRR